MMIARSVLSIAAGLASLVFGVVVPIGALLANRRIVLHSEDGHVSATPLVGSAFGLLAVALAPMGSLSDRLAWSWTPLAAEATLFGLSLAFWNLSGLRSEAERQRRSRRRTVAR